ncbi:Cys-tRNA(Pro) deacylase [Demequina sp. B12]|uniref:Cys-tRNA(Pro) deacylase n=1 Tax=Demequina sp. B12 TaxID=2992757 RepID=UPI00237A1233|nr:Cys-tRNA(Pro) deacylase [Demequina sp. B12]MDE0572728.1 Cys-tRNA(Pro) deacylase [Demequina sp. B12]
MPRRASASTPAVAALIRAGIAHELHPYEHDPASELSYGLEAAAALGVPPAQVFKTLCVLADGTLSMAITPVDGTLDVKAVAKALGAKRATMADPADAERATGYVVGGISPLGGRKRLPAVLDSSALDLDRVYVSGGQRGLDLSLAPTDLVRLTGAAVATIRKDS